MLILNADVISLSLLCLLMIFRFGDWGHVGVVFVFLEFSFAEASFHPS